MGLRSVRDQKNREMKKPPPLLTPRIIADLRSGDECEGARLLRRDLLSNPWGRAAGGLTRRELQDEVIRHERDGELYAIPHIPTQ